MRKILFICTGNYYRSKFAEIYFNHLQSQKESQSYKSFSRGIRIDLKNNLGNISKYASDYLKKLSVNTVSCLPSKQICKRDLESATIIIGIDKEEHENYLITKYPQYEAKYTFWDISDLYLKTSCVELPRLKQKIEELESELLKECFGSLEIS